MSWRSATLYVAHVEPEYGVYSVLVLHSQHHLRRVVRVSDLLPIQFYVGNDLLKCHEMQNSLI